MNKYLILILLSFNTFCFGQTIDKNVTDSLLIGTWSQFAFKPHNSSQIKEIPAGCMSKTISFQEDKTYEEELFCTKSSGFWYLNDDKTKLGFTLNKYNGQVLPVPKESKKYTNILIIKLTRDTLVYGSEGYYGNERIYGHDDWYFVKRK